MRRIGLLGLLLAVFTTSPVSATVFWEDDFEGSPPFASGGTWGPIGACLDQPEGCTPYGPFRTNTQGHSGTHSLQSHYETSCGWDYGPGCGTHIERTHPFTKHVYLRWWVKFGPGSAPNNNTGSKQFYNRSDDPNFLLIVWHIFPGTATIGGQFTHNGYVSDCPQGFDDNGNPTNGGPDQACNVKANMRNPINLFDGRWHCAETHAYSGTPGNYDGIAESWVDGVPATQYTGLGMKGPGVDSRYNIVMHYAQVGLGDRYVDQVAVGDARIGCGASVPSTTPNAPDGMTLGRLVAPFWQMALRWALGLIG